LGTAITAAAQRQREYQGCSDPPKYRCSRHQSPQVAQQCGRSTINVSGCQLLEPHTRSLYLEARLQQIGSHRSENALRIEYFKDSPFTEPVSGLGYAQCSLRLTNCTSAERVNGACGHLERLPTEQHLLSQLSASTLE
jgi:hypothetical protein